MFAGREHHTWTVKGRRKIAHERVLWEEAGSQNSIVSQKLAPDFLSPFLNFFHYGLLWKVCEVDTSMTRVDVHGFVFLPFEMFI